MSSSDEEKTNLSDDLQDQIQNLLNTLRVNSNVLGQQPVEEEDLTQQPQSSTSDGRKGCWIEQPARQLTPPALTTQQRVDGLIRDAENARARMNEVQGRHNLFDSANKTNPDLNNQERGISVIDCNNRFVHSAMVDEDYLIVAAHVEDSVVRKIKQGEFVDFAKLLPRDRVQLEQDSRMQLAMLDGHLSCMPNMETGVISLFAKWEQAFRVYSNIYTTEFPQRAAELIQYNHIIHTAALTCIHMI